MKSPCPDCGELFELHKFGPKKNTRCPKCRKIRHDESMAKYREKKRKECKSPYKRRNCYRKIKNIEFSSDPNMEYGIYC